MRRKEFGSTTFSRVRGLPAMNKNQVVLTNQIEFLLSKAHWELHKHLCGLKVKRDEEGGDRGALQRWISIYQTCSFECMDRRLSAAPPPLSWPYFLAHCQPEIKGFQSSTCGTAHTIQQKSWTTSWDQYAGGRQECGSGHSTLRVKLKPSQDLDADIEGACCYSSHDE